MLRPLLYSAVVGSVVWTGSTVRGNEAPVTTVRVQDGIVSFGREDECPTSRSFLTSYSHTGGCAAPSCGCSCGCDASGGHGAGDPYGAGGAPGMAGESGPANQLAGDFQDLLASDSGAGLGYDSVAPGMVGDFFGGGYKMRFDEIKTDVREYVNIGVAGGDRRFKIADNNSPFPVDRVFFNYSHFHNALRTADSKDASLERGTFGFEKTFFDRWWSAELRLPFLSGLSNNQFINGNNIDNTASEFGNIGLAIKRLLFRNEVVAASAGLGVVLPTGSDGTFFDRVGSTVPALIVENEAYYLQPFLGLFIAPNDRFFSQLAVQADFDARGNTVLVAGNGMQQAGKIQDQALMFLDASFGYWLFHDPNSGRILTGLAPMVELHHSTTLQNSDIVDFGAIVGGGNGDQNNITNPANRLDVLNLTGALRFEVAGTSYLTIAAITPLRDGDEKLFDTEFAVQFSRFY